MLLTVEYCSQRFLIFIRSVKLMIKVLVNGALGRMGSEVVKTVLEQEDMELVAAVDAFGADKMIPVKNGNQMAVATDLKAKLMVVKPDVVVDFTRPDVVMASLRTVLSAGVRAVVGTTGFSEADLAELDELAKANNTGILIAPNFALGAILMIKLACEAAKYFPNVEIIERHHDKKLDAPSGTAVITAQQIAEVRQEIHQGHPEEKELLAGARGADYKGMKIHSVRLPGYVASQEVIFGSQGETLRISNEPVNRECYMPGVMLGCRKMMDKVGLTYGLDKLL
jgi:4-hydroxy-tetrahydrodipicolinate reductase